MYDALGREVIQGLYTSTARPSLDDVVVKAKEFRTLDLAIPDMQLKTLIILPLHL